jgi:hypothetical protein
MSKGCKHFFEASRPRSTRAQGRGRPKSRATEEGAEVQKGLAVLPSCGGTCRTVSWDGYGCRMPDARCPMPEPDSGSRTVALRAEGGAARHNLVRPGCVPAEATSGGARLRRAQHLRGPRPNGADAAVPYRALAARAIGPSYARAQKRRLAAALQALARRPSAQLIAKTAASGRTPHAAATPRGASQFAKRLIGVGMAGLAPPLPPNRTSGSPASGSPVSGVSTRLTVSTRAMFQTK